MDSWLIRSNVAVKMFCGGRKTGEPREKSSESDRDQQSVLVYTRLGSKLVALQKLKYLGNDV